MRHISQSPPLAEPATNIEDLVTNIETLLNIPPNTDTQTQTDALYQLLKTQNIAK